eukprot:TRINITY_DN67509_c0_g1_i1.p1 TRINITY_DN67509_c0_g1~~TRINITY_DN67509_c0_g1_i1.p1  ORF type:complete len:405 (-),score=72.32 TRINITY_DN67509_c0_g1_i1:70-1284(-)
MRSCSKDVGQVAEDPLHACSRILKRMSQPDPLEYSAPVLTFDDVWKRELGSRHIDFLQVDLGMRGMAGMFEHSFQRLLSSRSFTVLAFRIDEFWTKDDLRKAVELLDKSEYFSMFVMVCRESSQVGSFSYHGPGGVDAGPTTYLPLSTMDIDRVVDWSKMPLPQDVLALDLKQPDVFKTVQLGDVHCDVDDEASDTCAADDEKCRAEAAAAEGPPERPQLLQVTRSGSRSLTLEWHPHPEGPMPDSYLLRVDPGAQEDTLDHDKFDSLTNVQSHTINGLRPDTEYTVSLRALGLGGESGKATITHRTQREEAPAFDSPYDVLEMHCGMGSAEEIQPPGPGTSFFPGVSDVEGCRVRCDDNRHCITFQVKSGDACWLYRRKPADSRLTSGNSEAGWSCAVRRSEV